MANLFFEPGSAISPRNSKDFGLSPSKKAFSPCSSAGMDFVY